MAFEEHVKPGDIDQAIGVLPKRNEPWAYLAVAFKCMKHINLKCETHSMFGWRLTRNAQTSDRDVQFHSANEIDAVVSKRRELSQCAEGQDYCLCIPEEHRFFERHKTDSEQDLNRVLIPITNNAFANISQIALVVYMYAHTAASKTRTVKESQFKHTRESKHTTRVVASEQAAAEREPEAETKTTSVESELESEFAERLRLGHGRVRAMKSSKAMTQRLMERRPDEMIVDLADAALAYLTHKQMTVRSKGSTTAPPKKLRFYSMCSQNRKFSLALDLEETYLVSIDEPNTAQSLADIFDTLKLEQVKQWRRERTQYLSYIMEKLVLTANTDYYMLTPSHRYMRTNLRWYNNSYLVVPSVSRPEDKDTPRGLLALPGWCYLWLHRRFAKAGGPQLVLPTDFFVHHLRLALARLGFVQSEDELAEQVRTSKSYDVWIELLCDMVAAPCRFGAPVYLHDTLDRCPRHFDDVEATRAASATSSSSSNSISSAGGGDVAEDDDDVNTVTLEATDAATRQRKFKWQGLVRGGAGGAGGLVSSEMARQKGRGRPSRSKTAHGRYEYDTKEPIMRELATLSWTDKHVIEEINQFRGVWDNMLQHLSGDDCESVAISTYMIWQQLKLWIDAVRERRVTPENGAQRLLLALAPVIDQYVCVIVTCSMQMDTHEKYQVESDHEEEESLEAEAVATGGNGTSLLRRDKYHDSRTECHVIALIMPRERVRTWVKRGLDYRKAIGSDAVHGDPQKTYVNAHTTPEPVRAYSNASMESTEYAFGLQMRAHMSAPTAAAATTAATPLYMYDHEAINAFYQDFHHTFTHDSAFFHRHPREKTADYDLYRHALTLACDEMREEFGWGEFAFVHTGRHRRGVLFAEIMSGDLDSLHSPILLYPTSTHPVSADDITKIERLTLAEIYAAVPRFDHTTCTPPYAGVAATTTPAAMLYIRDIDAKLYAESFCDWLEQRKSKYRLRREPTSFAAYDNAIVWCWEIECLV